MEQTQKDFRIARDEMSWFFAASSAAMGLHGQSIDGGAGGGHWDAQKSLRAHMSRWSPGHRTDLARYERIRTSLVEMAPGPRRDLELVYVPFGWGRLDGASDNDKDRANYSVYSRFSIAGRQLLPLALMTAEMQSAFFRAHPDRAPDDEPSFRELLTFVAGEIGRLKDERLTARRGERIAPGKALPPNHRLLPALRAADAREKLAIAAYDEVRILRVRARRRPNVALLNDLLAKQEERDRRLFEKKTGIRLERVA